MIGTPMTARQIGELEARDFLGDDTWKRWKLEYDNCMGFRKSYGRTMRGKPDDADRAILAANDASIEFLGSALFHSTMLARSNGKPGGLCGCTACGQKRTSVQPAAVDVK